MAKATSSHPAFNGISRGDLVSIPYLKDNQIHRGQREGLRLQ